MHTSEKMKHQLDLWEGDVLTCYLDPIGVPTIGKGLTNHSKTLTKLLGKLIPGKTKITKQQSEKIFEIVLAEEYEPFVNMPGAKQHEFDVGVSVVWNLGPKAMNWRWAEAWREGEKTAAAAILGSNYNTAAGVRLAGLTRRRRAEADLLLTGIYPYEREKSNNIVVRWPDEKIKEAQKMLTQRGYDVGKIDGIFGPKTSAAVLEYQKMHPHLVNDGIIGPATIAQLKRDAMAVKDTITKGGGAVAIPGAISFFSGLPWGWIVAFLAAIVVCYFAWKWRDVLLQRFNRLFGRVREV